MAASIFSDSLLRVRVSRSTCSIALMIEPFCWLSEATVVSRLPSSARMSPVRPSIMVLSSSLIVFSCPTPPPASRKESAPSTSSTSGLRLVRSSPIVAPSPSLPALAMVDPSGATRAMYFSPSRLVWRTLASASAGSSMFLRRVMVTFACQPSRSTLSTWPTGTSLAITLVRGTTSTTSLNSAVTT